MSWLRKKKQYSRPRKLYNKTRIEEENGLIKKYGLKNKREIWKADSAISRIRNQAKGLITASKEKQDVLLNKLNKIGFKVEKIADVLSLNKENWLKRRLQTFLVEKNMAKPKEARQLIAHKHVFVNGRIINIPSYVVKIEDEDKINVIRRIKAEKQGGKDGG